MNLILRPFKVLGDSYLLLILSLILIVLVPGWIGNVFNLFSKCSNLVVVPIDKKINDFKDLEVLVKENTKKRKYELHLACEDIPDSVIQNVILGDTLLIKVLGMEIYGMKRGDLVVFEENVKRKDEIKTIVLLSLLIILISFFFRFKYLALKKELNF